MKVKGRVVETLTVVKEVEVDLPDESEDCEIEQAIRDEAYKATLKDQNGWEMTDTLDVEIIWEGKDD